ncbi:radical SAM family heme chaperone HemW [Fodinicola feengrottensis]|uniref:radical SAM family heme chaperone HemW n=1 Tax=Fodinicola feengrottensis TaxID=435914 RepID=UPI002441787D|nr:radical SAM family heme chaperone HemW [Fodinicola feengrottensis]
MPADGSLPPAALDELTSRAFGAYVHVPYCTTRCGYCDFNTYTASELDGDQGEHYLDSVRAEIELAAAALGGRTPAIDTVFVGGGTPTLLPPAELGRTLADLRAAFGFAAGVEVTTECNPETVDERSLAALVEAGFTRLSLGMQSAREHVLAVLDRHHTPGRAEAVARWARRTGFEHVSLDLIYGAPGETADDWQASLDAVLATGVDHVSAYSLIVEPGTRLHRRVSRGEVAVADDDTLAERYEQAERTLTAAGLGWYEVSNWSLTSADRCRHNEGYWRSANWWGFGPGAHSHVGGTRWWNVKHPAAYGSRLAEKNSPAYARELLSAQDRRVEDIMLRVRTTDGLPLGVLTDRGRDAAADALGRGLLEPGPYATGTAVLTLPGRLLADAVVRDLVD